MPTKEELEDDLNKREREVKKLEKQVSELNVKIRSNLNRNFLYQTIIGVALIIGSVYIPNSNIEAGRISGDILIFAGVFSLTIQGILQVLRVWKGFKS